MGTRNPKSGQTGRWEIDTGLGLASALAAGLIEHTTHFVELVTLNTSKNIVTVSYNGYLLPEKLGGCPSLGKVECVVTVAKGKRGSANVIVEPRGGEKLTFQGPVVRFDEIYEATYKAVKESSEWVGLGTEKGHKTIRFGLPRVTRPLVLSATLQWTEPVHALMSLAADIANLSIQELTAFDVGIRRHVGYFSTSLSSGAPKPGSVLEFVTIEASAPRKWEIEAGARLEYQQAFLKPTVNLRVTLTGGLHTEEATYEYDVAKEATVPIDKLVTTILSIVPSSD